MGRLFIVSIICFVFSSFVLHFVIKGRDVGQEARKNQAELKFVDESIASVLSGYILDLQMLVSDSSIVEGVLKGQKELIETRIDGLMSFFIECELVIISNLKGEIIASNTVNKRVRSFNNTILLGKKVDAFEWHKIDKSNMPRKLNGFEVVKGGMPSFLFDGVKGKDYIEVVSAVMDITGSRIGVVTAYYNYEKIEKISRAYHVELSIFDTLPEAVYNQKLDYSVDAVSIFSSRRLQTINAIELSKKKKISLFSFSLYEYSWFAASLVFWCFLYFLLKKKYGTVIKETVEKNIELSKLRAYKSMLESYGIHFLDDKNLDMGIKKGFTKIIGNKGIILESELVNEITEPVSSKLIYFQKENNSFKTELELFNKLKEDYSLIVNKSEELNSRLEAIYVTVGSLIKYLSKVEKRKELEFSENIVTNYDPILINKLENVVSKREKIISTLRDLAEESSMLLNVVYPLCLDTHNKEFLTLFDSIKKRLRFFMLNIGALEGFFNDVNIQGMTVILKEHVDLKKDNHRLRFFSEKAKLLESDLGFCKKALSNTIVSLKEIEQGVIENDITNFDL